jgi:hypothetical protein
MAARRDADGLWAITSFYNPVGYRRRIENYRRFRERLSVPLVAVELGYRSDFELGEGDADILVQLRGIDVMWQKERLLNIAVKALPAHCTKVAWIDSDVLFERDDWPDRAAETLEKASFVHLFSQVHYMPPDAHPDSFSTDIAEARRTSLVAAAACGASVMECFDDANRRVFGHYSPGFAWAARRSFIERVGLYDCCIVGGGDRAMAAAAYGYYDHVIKRHHMIDGEAARYIAWAEPFHDAVDAAIDFVEGDIFHLWHGALLDRRLRERHRWLSHFAFDPTADIALADNSVWRWNSHKPDMHAFVRERFVSRREDG